MAHSVVVCHTQSLCQIIVAQQKLCFEFCTDSSDFRKAHIPREKNYLSFYTVGDQIGYNDVDIKEHKGTFAK